MSMDEPAVNHDIKDTDMSEAAPDDPELALGEFLCFLIIIYLYTYSAKSYFFEGLALLNHKYCVLFWEKLCRNLYLHRIYRKAVVILILTDLLSFVAWSSPIVSSRLHQGLIKPVRHE